MSLVSQLISAKNKIVLVARQKIGKPESFMNVLKDAKNNYVLPQGYSSVVEIGELRSVSHLTFHDMEWYAINCRMTDLKYQKSLKANAVYVSHKKFERLDMNNGVTYFQPLQLRR